MLLLRSLVLVDAGGRDPIGLLKATTSTYYYDNRLSHFFFKSDYYVYGVFTISPGTDRLIQLIHVLAEHNYLPSEADG